MNTKFFAAFAIAVSLVAAVPARAQGPAGAGEGAATIPGSEVRAGENGRVNSGAGVTTGSSTLRSESRTTAVTPNGTRVDTTVAPGGLVGRDAPDATQAAPAGR